MGTFLNVQNAEKLVLFLMFTHNRYVSFQTD